MSALAADSLGFAARGTIVFDMDGVLVDVTDSYRETIRETVRHYTGIDVEHETIQDYKNQGGWNNDWALSQKLILDLSGKDIPYDEVVRYFQDIFFGNDLRLGFITRERWLPVNGMLERLERDYRLAIFTGRLRAEANITLHRFAPKIEWDMIVGDDDVMEHKPAPEGLIRIAAEFPQEPLTYLGDTVDDAASARAAGVRFIGVASAANPKRAELVALLEEHGAAAVIENINELETVL